jgi:hypothetical protein
MGQGILAHRLRAALIIEQDQFAGGTAMAAEVDDIGLNLQQGLLQVIRPGGPPRDQLEGIAVGRRTQLRRDLALLLVDLQLNGAGRIGGDEEGLDSVHVMLGGRARSLVGLSA